MVQRGEHLGFAGEAGQAVGILREGVGQNFDGDFAIQFGVGGALHLAHASLAEFGGDAVVRNDCRVRHGVESVYQENVGPRVSRR